MAWHVGDIMVESYLAEDKPYALSQSGTDAKEDSLGRQRHRNLMMPPSSKH